MKKGPWISFCSCVILIIGLTANQTLAHSANEGHKYKKPPIHYVTGAIFDVDVSGVVTGTADWDLPYAPGVMYTMTNVAEVYDSSYVDLPCISAPPFRTCAPNRGFRHQIPAQYCDGQPHTLSVYSRDNYGEVVFLSPIDSKAFTCYVADTPDKIPPFTPVIFIPGIAGSVLTERKDDGTEVTIWPNQILSFSGLERLNPSAGANII
ncbi:MAG: hypothetical protein ACRD43_05725, partial [Pyrinomonadaceae bacterium]